MWRSFKDLYAVWSIPEECAGRFCGFSVDSRTVQPGQIYCAIRGERVDGHLFVQEALDRGAAAVLVDRPVKVQGPCFSLPSVVKGMQKLANYYLKDKQVVAITGSVGKTTTKEFLATLLEGSFRVGKSPANQNSQIGMPLGVLNCVGPDQQVWIQEMGMNHPGQIQQLVQVAPPDVALIVNVDLVHVAHFSGLEDIGREKSAIFSHPKTKVALYASQAASYIDWEGVQAAQKISFGGEQADYRWEKGVVYEKNSRFPMQFPTHLPGYFSHNLLGAIAVARVLGVSPQQIAQRLSLLRLPEQRFQEIFKADIRFIDDSYNACATSVKAALRSLPPVQEGGKRLAVLGQMLELGDFTAKSHEEVGQEALAHVDQLLCIGQAWGGVVDLWKEKGKPVFWAQDHASLKEKLFALANRGDVVLLKGSKFFKLWTLLE